MKPNRLNAIPALLCAVALLAGCSSLATRSVVDLSAFKHIYVVHRLTDDHRGDELFVRELKALGHEASNGPLTMLPENADAVLPYDDRWEWDFKTYLIELDINLRTARTDKKLADGRYYQPSPKTRRLCTICSRRCSRRSDAGPPAPAMDIRAAAGNRSSRFRAPPRVVPRPGLRPLHPLERRQPSRQRHQPLARRGVRRLRAALFRGTAADVQPAQVSPGRLGRAGETRRHPLRRLHRQAPLGLLHVAVCDRPSARASERTVGAGESDFMPDCGAPPPKDIASQDRPMTRNAAPCPDSDARSHRRGPKRVRGFSRRGASLRSVKSMGSLAPRSRQSIGRKVAAMEEP